MVTPPMLTVVTGPPCAGKSTHVRRHAQCDDIIIDLDRIALALAHEGTTHHAYPPHIRHIAINARAEAIRTALPLSRDYNVWIIHMQPSKRDWVAYKQHDARTIRLDPGYEEVMRRCANERPAWVSTTAHEWYAQA